jgi:hypothetical protein
MPFARRFPSQLEAVILYIAISYSIDKILDFVASLGYFTAGAGPYDLIMQTLRLLLAPLYAIRVLLAYFYAILLTLDDFSIREIVFHVWLLIVLHVLARHWDRIMDWMEWYPEIPRRPNTMMERLRRFILSYVIWTAMCMPLLIMWEQKWRQYLPQGVRE